MALKDTLAMEVPRFIMQQIAQTNRLKSEGSTAEDYADTLVKAIPDTANILADQYRFAGKTAANLYLPRAGIGPEWNDKEYFRRKIMAKHARIFTDGLRPELTEIPKLIKIQEKGEAFILIFSYLGHPRRVWENYEIVTRRPQLIDYVVAHFNPFIIEIRAAIPENKKFRSAVLDVMGIPSETKATQVIWEQLTKLTPDETTELVRRLHARLKGAKHKMTEGIYDTKEVVANPNIKDLSQEPEYINEFGGIPCKNQGFEFTFTHSFGPTEVISFKIGDKGLNFQKVVSEEVIDTVIGHIIEIRLRTWSQGLAEASVSSEKGV